MSQQATENDGQNTGGDLKLTRVTKDFGGFKAVDDIDLTIPQGSFFALLGPSGCGKTTTLRMVAGLEHPTAGSIHIGNQDITGTKPYKRPVNTVFQSYALFPHMDIFENVAFGLRRRRSKSVKQQVDDVLELVELTALAKRRPQQLSGGQQQRVALARAIVNRPGVLLLDEPLGALDLKLRRQMQVELKQIQTEVGLTFVHVTHDQEEAMTMADTIAVMNGGRIEQLGAPVELYDAPRTTFVANFLGQSNLVQGTVTSTTGDRLVVDLHGTTGSVLKSRAAVSSGQILVGIRPEKLHVITDTEPHPELDVVPGGVITDASFIGVSTQYLVRMPWGQELVVFEQNRESTRVLSRGTKVALGWNPEHSFGLSAEQDAAAGAMVDEEAVAS
ncbi:MAG TPA: ABC transporter ATP-binding protein [Candidatus Nanopelagicales bacterium]|jgi:spermidine/putrescine transport system ATP-binding protein